MTAVLYAAVLLSLVTFFLHLDNAGELSPRMGLIGGALFAAAINHARRDLGARERV
jgi:hypothetical protein